MYVVFVRVTFVPFGDSLPDQDDVTDYTLQYIFPYKLEPHRVTQGGGFFLLFILIFAPPSSCGSCLRFFPREGFSCPVPLSTVLTSKFDTVPASACIAFTSQNMHVFHSMGFNPTTLRARWLR